MLPPNTLERILGQTSKIRILRFLVESGLELNGREIATSTGLSHVKVHTALKELNEHGVVLMRTSGRSILYQLNLKNILVKKIVLPIFEKESQIKTIIGEIVAKHLEQSAPKSLILFGSFAKGNAKPGSDIDLLVVTSKNEGLHILKEGLDRAETSITLGFGHHLAPLVMDKEEFRTRFMKREKLVRSIVKEGKVLFGESINDLIKPND